MSGYIWAKTAEGELFVVLVVDGKGYVPGVENAIDLDQIEALEPVKWPSAITQRNPSSDQPRPGALAAAATQECAILPFAANG